MQRSQTPAEAWNRLTGLTVEQALAPDESTESLLYSIRAHWEEMFGERLPHGELALLRRYIEANRPRATI